MMTNEQCVAMKMGSADVDADYEGEEEEYEVEEAVDDVSMHVLGRVFVGSIDAARNMEALQRARIGFSLALLGADDECVGSENTGTRATAAGSGGGNGYLMQTHSAGVQREVFPLEDAFHEDLFGKLPALLARLNAIMYVACRSLFDLHYCLWKVREMAILSFVLSIDLRIASRQGEREDKNVLVHCMAGRSRSPALIAAWLLTQAIESYPSANHAIEQLSLIRPWIELNPHFQKQLQLFHHVLMASHSNQPRLPRDVIDALLSRTAMLPRLDFGPFLAPDILNSKKTVTMRLESDVIDDKNSDLGAIMPHSTVLATTAAADGDDTQGRHPFAVLYIQACETKTLCELEAQDLHKSGFASIPEVLAILKQFYPHVSESTPLCMLHFACIGEV
ncbi:Dual specificity phosphatase, partial [Globisporangium splendens]